LQWYQNKRNKVLRNRFPQVKAYVIQYKLNLENSKMEYIKKWIRGIKKIKRNEKELKSDDIRMYFS